MQPVMGLSLTSRMPVDRLFGKNDLCRGTVVRVNEVTGGVRAPEEDGDVPGFWRGLGVPGLADYEAFLRLAVDYERVFLDTTMIFTDFFDHLAPFPAAALPLARELGLAGKILLGSDFPNIPYPYARQLAGLARLDLGEDWLRAVCWNNPVALFGAPG